MTLPLTLTGQSINPCIYRHYPALAANHAVYWLAGQPGAQWWICAACHRPLPGTTPETRALAELLPEEQSRPIEPGCGHHPANGIDLVDRKEDDPIEQRASRMMPDFRAANERAWWLLFGQFGPVKYEALEPDISRAIRYMPDLWLPDALTWIEIKSAEPTPGEIEAARLLLRATGRRVYVVSGWPWPRSFEVCIFSEAGDFRTARKDWCLLALCQLVDCSLGEMRAAMEGVRAEVSR